MLRARRNVCALQVWETVSPRMSGKALEWLRQNTKPLGAGAAAGNGNGASKGAEKAKAGASA